jgi:hypothetical protein
MKTIEEINIKNKMSEDDFKVLFSNLPLNEEEQASLTEYYQMYTTFITADVTPNDSWLATRNIFFMKNQQLKDRIK